VLVTRCGVVFNVKKCPVAVLSADYASLKLTTVVQDRVAAIERLAVPHLDILNIKLFLTVCADRDAISTPTV